MDATPSRKRRAFGGDAAEDAAPSYPPMNGQTGPSYSNGSASQQTGSSRTLRSKNSDSLLKLSTWIAPEPLLAKEKLDLKHQRQTRDGPLAGLGGGLEALPGAECVVLTILWFVTCIVRLWRIDQPSSVVFDEVHFGGFASKYIKSRFFMDVHPPLAKLLITLAAFVFGFKGDFDFKDIGKEYGPDHVPYIAMRLVPALFGIGVIPLAYCTIRMNGLGPAPALLAGVLICFENGLVTQSRLILLDSPLVFFTALSVFFWSGFCAENKQRPFAKRWWIWLSLTGLSLGAVLSVKWVGLFTFATIGVATIMQLWELLGDLNISIRTLFRHFVARAICLIGLPLMMYMAMFEIHFLVLSNSGDGDGFMSSEFQHSLRGHGMEDTYADVALGSKIAIRHLNTQGGYLHSHPHNYPTGSKQQQITLYPHRDDNNIWHVMNATADPDFDDQTGSPVRYITDGMHVKFDHVSSKKKLHSHDIRPPVSEVDWQNEASAYGFENFDGDANDYWVVEIEKDWTDKGDRKAKQRLRTIRTKFRLRHLLQGCYLFSHKVKLPDWGFEQQEVTCNKNPTKANSIWYVETNTHPMLQADAEKVNYRRPGFLSKFKELNAVMWRTNQGLTDRHAYDSRPHSWPYLRRGINFWVKNNRQIYLIGNPIIWWLSSLSILLYGFVRAVIIIRAQRGCHDLNNTTTAFYDRLCMFFAIGWLLHYFPFFIMGRQLFLHHYFPALYFSILLLAVVFDLSTIRFQSKVKLQIAGVIILVCLWSFWHWSPLVYGNRWTKKECEKAKWLKHWDFSCNDFKDRYSDYLPSNKHHPGGIETGAAGANTTSNSLAVPIEPGRNMFHEKLIDKVGEPSSSVPPNLHNIGAVDDQHAEEDDAIEYDDDDVDDVEHVEKIGDVKEKERAKAEVKNPEKLPENQQPPLHIVDEDDTTTSTTSSDSKVADAKSKEAPLEEEVTNVAATEDQQRREEKAPIPAADPQHTGDDSDRVDQDPAVRKVLQKEQAAAARGQKAGRDGGADKKQ